MYNINESDIISSLLLVLSPNFDIVILINVLEGISSHIIQMNGPGPLRGGRWGYFPRAWTNRGPEALMYM